MVLYQHNQGRTVGSVTPNAHQRTATAEFELSLAQLGVKVVLLQDISQSFKTPKNYTLFAQPGGATAVLTHNTLHASPIPKHSIDTGVFSS